MSERSGKINSLDGRGRTALHWAAVRGREDLVNTLLEAGANTDLRDDTGATPAHLAVQSASPGTVEIFITRGHHLLLDNQGRTPLMWAVVSGEQQMVELFMNVELDSQDKLGNSALHIAVVNKLPDSVKSLIQLGAEINLTNKKGETGLMVAARTGGEEEAELLVKEGADHREEALLLASAHGNLAIVKLLLRSGADVNSEDHSGRSPLIMASYGGHRDTVVFLMDNKAEVDHQDREGMCSLHWAVRRGHLKTVRTLLDRGAFPNNIGRQMTPLDSAVMLDQTEIIGLLQREKVVLVRGVSVSKCLLQAVTIARIYNIAATRIQAFYRGYKIRNTYTSEVRNLMAKHMHMVKERGHRRKRRRKRSRRHKSGEAETDLSTSENSRIVAVAGEFLGSVVEGHQRSSYLRRVQAGEDEPLPGGEEGHRDILALPLTGTDRPDSHFSYNLHK